MIKYYSEFPEIREKVNNKDIIYLNEDKTSYLILDKLPEDLFLFQDIWNLKPNERPDLTVYDKKYKTPRFVQTYGRTYNYSNIEQDALEISEELQQFLDFGNEYMLEHEIIYPKFNQILVNWYESGDHYIGPHSDDETQLYKNENGESFIFSITLTDELETSNYQNRIFRLKPKGKGRKRLDIETENGSIIIMSGLTQKTHTHQVPKTKKQVMMRINITLRSFK